MEYYGDENTIIANTIEDNFYGILVESYCQNNHIYHNNFLSNWDHVNNFESTNVWDNGYPSGGNYWDDYTGVDNYRGPGQNMTGSDGIGDTPYSITYYGQDQYPLMDPWDE